MTTSDLSACAVLLAGGRGTRFWPRSRMRRPKQLLSIGSGETMLRETIARLSPLFPRRNLWAVTNGEQVRAVRREMRGVPAAHILAEPVGRNTAAAIGLAAIHLAHVHGDALMAVLPSDSHIGEVTRYRKLVTAALDLARVPGNLVIFGIPPTRPETGYGYIERGALFARVRGARAFAVKRFTEKPAVSLAKRYVASKRYLWNGGMFFWRVSTFLDALKKFLPATYDLLSGLCDSIGTRRYATRLRHIYSEIESISVDYAVMEQAARSEGKMRVVVIPADVRWNDIGSWAAVYELLVTKPGANVSEAPFYALDSSGNYFWSPKKFIAAIGVRDLVVVETDDALLLCPRERSQDVGKIVKWLEDNGHRELL